MAKPTLEASQIAPQGNSSETIPTTELTSPWLPFADTDSERNSTIQNEPPANPWLAAGYKKSLMKLASDNRITKVQNKRMRDEAESTDAQVRINVSAEEINQKIVAAREQEAGDEDTSTMTYGRGKIAFRQQELVSRAFAADGFEEEFVAEKTATIAEDAPKEEDLTLPGWGSWTGKGVKRRALEKKLIRKIPGIEESKRKDAKLKHVIINEKHVKNVAFSFFSLTLEY